MYHMVDENGNVADRIYLRRVWYMCDARERKSQSCQCCIATVVEMYSQRVFCASDFGAETELHRVKRTEGCSNVSCVR
jgi:hypothetical protein